MKTRTIFLTVLIATSSLLAMASGKPQTNIQSLNEKQLLVSVETDKADKLEVCIYDEDKNIIYFKQSNKAISKFNKIFDVESLENGQYTMELSINGLISKRDLSIANNLVKVGKEEAINAPFFVLKENELHVTHLNFNNKKYNLSIYDENGLLYEKAVGNSVSINAGLNLSQLENGNYVAVLASGKEEFDFNFEK